MPVNSADTPIRVQAVQVSKFFGPLRALHNVSLSVIAGSSVAIMGPSASGKSTLLHCLSGILPADEGRISLNGTEISQLSDARRSALRLSQCGFIFQDGQLIDELTAVENVALPLMVNGMKRRPATNLAHDWLARLGVSEVATRRRSDMSGGQVQRVAIARALATQPSIIFADEPTGALDQSSGHEVMQVLIHATQLTGATLLIVTHDPAVAHWCERLIEIRDGQLHSDHALGSTTPEFPDA